MITKDQATRATYRKEFHHVTLKNADNTPLRARVNGACKTLKTQPEFFKLPMKHGLKQCFYIDNANCADWIDPTL